MQITKAYLKKEIEQLPEDQLGKVHSYIVFMNFQKRCSRVPDFEYKHGALYKKFVNEDRQLAEEGIFD